MLHECSLHMGRIAKIKEANKYTMLEKEISIQDFVLIESRKLMLQLLPSKSNGTHKWGPESYKLILSVCDIYRLNKTYCIAFAGRTM